MFGYITVNKKELKKIVKHYFEDNNINPDIKYRNLKELYSVFASDDETEESIEEVDEDESDTASV